MPEYRFVTVVEPMSDGTELYQLKLITLTGDHTLEGKEEIDGLTTVLEGVSYDDLNRQVIELHEAAIRPMPEQLFWENYSY